jgi:transmembrane sensor
MHHLRMSNAINDIAAEWVARVDRGPLTAAEQTEFDAWLAADTRHLGAYARAMAVFQHARRARALGRGFNPDTFLVAGTPDSAGAPEPRPADEFLGSRSETASRLSRRSFLGVAASTVVAVGAAAYFGVSSRAVAQTFRTARGELRLVPLEDGSTVTLNTASEIQVLYKRRQRSVTLVEGEALFEVVQDPERPFLVDTAAFQARAVGTSFVVRSLQDGPAEILVRDGMVEVLTASSQPVRATANVRVSVGAAGVPQATRLSALEVERELMWREGKISFEDIPLFVAAQVFARYSGTRILIEQREVAALTVTGVFTATNPAGFAQAVAEALQLRAETVPGGIRLIATR